MEAKVLIRRMYNGQVANSRTRNHPPPEYSFSELYLWVINRPNFSTLYYNWIASGRLKNFIPSIDRKSSNVHYKFSNIQLVTFQENFNNFKEEVSDGRYKRKIKKKEPSRVKPLLTIYDVAKRLKCSTDIIRSKVNSGQIPFINFYGLIRFELAEIKLWTINRNK